MSSWAAIPWLCVQHQLSSVACRYLVHMVQLDAAAMNLKRRFEDPNITASLEAQQAYTRALAPGGDCYPVNAPSERCACTLHHPATSKHERCAVPCWVPAPCAGAVLGLPGVLQRPLLGRRCCRCLLGWQSYGHLGHGPPRESPSALLVCVMQGRSWCKPRRR